MARIIPSIQAKYENKLFFCFFLPDFPYQGCIQIYSTYAYFVLREWSGNSFLTEYQSVFFFFHANNFLLLCRKNKN